MGKLNLPTRHKLAAPFQSRETLIEFLKAPQGVDGHTTIGDARWSNKDLEPTPEEQRTWTW
jgi:NCS1 family nucleobase:cation symporter-1